MPLSQAITETIILHLKEGISLEDVASGTGVTGSPAVQAFVELANTIKAQQGFICQFWGHQAEDRTIFVWCIDWASIEHHAAFVISGKYKSFIAGVSQVFDLEVAAPLKIYTRFTSDSTAALKEPVTEVAFLTLPTGAGEEVKTIIEETMKPIGEAVTTVGKSPASSVGWVYEVIDHAEAVEGKSISLHGVFGYASIDDHMKWRETPEHAEATKVMEHLKRTQGLRDASVKGRGMFHVHFHAGI